MKQRLARALYEAKYGGQIPFESAAHGPKLEAERQAEALLATYSRSPLAWWVKGHWVELGCAFILLNLGVFVALIFLVARTIP